MHSHVAVLVIVVIALLLLGIKRAKYSSLGNMASTRP